MVVVFAGKGEQMIQLSHHFLSLPSRIGMFRSSIEHDILSFLFD
jgi:hypothetical protein